MFQPTPPRPERLDNGWQRLVLLETATEQVHEHAIASPRLRPGRRPPPHAPVPLPIACPPHPTHRPPGPSCAPGAPWYGPFPMTQPFLRTQAEASPPLHPPAPGPRATSRLLAHLAHHSPSHRGMDWRSSYPCAAPVPSASLPLCTTFLSSPPGPDRSRSLPCPFPARRRVA